MLDRQGSTGSGAGSGGCPQLVSFYDAYVNPTEGTVSIVQEYMDGGSLQVRFGFTAVYVNQRVAIDGSVVHLWIHKLTNQDIVDGGGCAHEAILAHIAHQVLQVCQRLD